MHHHVPACCWCMWLTNSSRAHLIRPEVPLATACTEARGKSVNTVSVAAKAISRCSEQGSRKQILSSLLLAALTELGQGSSPISHRSLDPAACRRNSLPWWMLQYHGSFPAQKQRYQTDRL
jgi:hypothetical protein